MNCYLVRFIAILAAAACVGQAMAAQHNLYVTVDGRPELTFGTYAGQPNPNSGKLTLLYAHWNDVTPSSNHFHGIGVYSLTGPVDSPSIVDTNGNNRLPETFTGQAPLTLQPGVGSLAGKLVSGENGEHYSDLTLYSIHDLADDATASPTSPEGYMYYSNAGYTNTPMTGLDLALEIVSMSPGLFLSQSGLDQPGDKLPIGGEASLPFEPVFWTDASATPGTYSASLRLVDQSGTHASSGVFHVDFAVVPEPAGGMLALASALGLATALRRRG